MTSRAENGRSTVGSLLSSWQHSGLDADTLVVLRFFGTAGRVEATALRGAVGLPAKRISGILKRLVEADLLGVDKAKVAGNRWACFYRLSEGGRRLTDAGATLEAVIDGRRSDAA